MRTVRNYHDPIRLCSNLLHVVLSTQKLVGYGLFIYGLLVISRFYFLAIPPALLVYATLVILLAIVGLAIQIIVVLALLLIGFASAGIRSGTLILAPVSFQTKISGTQRTSILPTGSLASGFQSSNYGATIPTGGAFSRMQSTGARSGSDLGYGGSSFSIDVRSLSIVIGFVSCAAGICLVFNDLLYPA